MTHPQLAFEPHAARPLEDVVDLGSQLFVVEKQREVLVHVALTRGTRRQDVEAQRLGLSEVRR